MNVGQLKKILENIPDTAECVMMASNARVYTLGVGSHRTDFFMPNGTRIEALTFSRKKAVNG